MDYENNIDRAIEILYEAGVGSKDEASYLIHRLVDEGIIVPEYPGDECAGA